MGKLIIFLIFAGVMTLGMIIIQSNIHSLANGLEQTAEAFSTISNPNATITAVESTKTGWLGGLFGGLG